MSKYINIAYKILYKCSSRKVKRNLKLLKHGWSLMVSPDSWLVSSGYVKSFLSSEMLSQEGEPLPWMNYSVIDFLNRHLKKDILVFEYGSGSSTLFFSRKVKNITSVEYDTNWYERISSRIAKENLLNVDYIYCPLGDAYVNAIFDRNDMFDLVVVDGRTREKCAIAALEKLSANGVLLLDDSNRKEYANIFKYYSKNGFSSLTFSGLKPMGFGTEFTTIFYKKMQNCLNI